MLALRECVLRFAPYGFRATWHHLVVGEPSLVRMLEELEQARLVWLASEEDFIARRRREKAAGHRIPSHADRWRTRMLAYCPVFDKHPTARLAVVVQRVIAAHESGASRSTLCFACGRTPASDVPCPECGVDPLGLGARRAVARPDDAHRWREVWLRGKENT
ncbi:hypothetical protein SAMN05421504_104389 [Amycolatopsis xylanica]|uniref:Uncharacterized protein n=1 Tax=Amycolatopsis xylanica TaxID=589385 RepID=A0A1H3GSL7_9PSEU|nr:hypothetical protein SAMN05421504_104389 [Amycolatopsis xylanica]